MPKYRASLSLIEAHMYEVEVVEDMTERDKLVAVNWGNYLLLAVDKATQDELEKVMLALQKYMPDKVYIIFSSEDSNIARSITDQLDIYDTCVLREIESKMVSQLYADVFNTTYVDDICALSTGKYSEFKIILTTVDNITTYCNESKKSWQPSVLDGISETGVVFVQGEPEL